MTDVRARVMTIPLLFITWYESHIYNGHHHPVALSCGLMLASAVVLPSFATDTLEAKELYKITLVIFGVSALSFSWIHRIVIKENGPLGLMLSLLTASMALFGLRPSAKDFAPYIPLSAALGILIVVYVVPWARNSVHTPIIHALENFVRTGNVSQTPGSVDTSMGSASIRSRGYPLEFLNQYIRSDLEPRDLEYIGFRGEYSMAAIPAPWDGLSLSGSESELNAGPSNTTSEAPSIGPSL